MKQFLRHIFLLLALFMATTSAWAECYLYENKSITIEYDDNDHNDSGTFSSTEYSLVDDNGVFIGGTMTFKYDLSGRTNASYWHKLTIQGYTGSTWQDIWDTGDIYNKDSKTANIGDISSWKNYSKIRFKRTAKKASLSSWSKGERDINVTSLYITRLTSISPESASHNFGNIEVGKSSSKGFTFEYSNVGTTISATSNSEHFSVQPTTPIFDNCSGTSTLTVTFNPKSSGNYSGQITLTCKDGNTTKKTVIINVSGKGTGEPEHRWDGKTAFLVDESVDLSTWFSSNEHGARTYEIVSFSPDDETGVTPTLNGNTIKLTRAGKLTVRMKQKSYDIYTYKESTQTFTISKHNSNFKWNNPDNLQCYVDDFCYDAFLFSRSSDLPLTITSSNPNVVSYQGGTFTAVGAGTAVITVKQDKHYKWTDFTETYTIHVNKYDVSAQLSQYNALWNELIDNAVIVSYGLQDYTVTSLNTDIAQYVSGNKIQTYYTEGTAQFTVTRDEDRKYKKLDVTLDLNVNKSSEKCILFSTSENEEYKVGYYDNKKGFDFNLGGEGTEISIELKKQQYATDGGYIYIICYNASSEEVKRFSVKNTEISTDWSTYSYDISSYSVTKVNVRSSGDSYHDALNKYFRNLKISRKTYLRPSVTSLTLPQTNLGKSSQNSFDLSWSTCSDDIQLVISNNDLFEVLTAQIHSTAHNGTTNDIVVRFKGADQPGTYTADVTIYDQSQSKVVRVTCEVKDKLTTEIVYDGKYQYSEAQECIQGMFSVVDGNGDVVYGANIVLTSSNNYILEICDNAGFFPHCGGQVTLTANYEGNDTHAAAPEWSKTIQVANCYQTIDWDQDFRQYIAAEDGTINQTTPLTAVAVPTNFDITYELDEAAQKFAKIENGSLVIFGIGTGHIIASAPSGTYETKYYDAASLMYEIRVRKWWDKCNTDESVASDEIPLSALLSWFYDDEEVIELDGRPYERLEFYSHVSSGSWENELTVSFSTDGGATWSNLQTYNIPDTYNWNTPYIHANVPEGANQVKFKTTSTGMTYFNMAKMVQKTYLEANVTEIRIDDAIVNTQFSREFKVKYSDIPLLQYVISDSHDLGLKLTSTPAIANDCGDWGEYTFTLTGESPYPQTDVQETITFSTSAGDILEIPVIITATLSDPFYFNVADNGDWQNSTNWTYQGSTTHGMLPDKRFPIVVSKALAINNGELVAYGVTIDEGGSVNIQPTGGLSLHAGGFITEGVTKDNFTVCNNQDGVGYVRVSPYFTRQVAGAMPHITVQYTTRAKAGGAKDQVWQYLGAPGENIEMSNDGVMVYYWNERAGWQTSNTNMTPFAGYALTRTAAGSETYKISAQPINSDHTIDLTYTQGAMEGGNLFVNSYLAPIDVTKFTDDINDFEGDIEKTFYLFNSGSWDQWQGQGGSTNTMVNGSSAGQYYAIAPFSAAFTASEEQKVIPPMQGVYVVVGEGGGKIKLQYNKHIFRAKTTDMNRPMRAPQEEKENFMRLRLQVNSQNSGADRMYLIQHENTTRGYDNGYDAKNILAEGQANIYTNEVDGQMEISVADQIDSTFIGFTAGEDSVYTLTFTSLVGEDMYLHDLVEDSLFLLVEDGQYTFFAQANSVNDMRFQLILHPELPGQDEPEDNMTTGMDNVMSSARVWVNDKRIYIAAAPQNSTIAVYTVSGMCITSPLTIHEAPCTVDLSHLPTGVYVLRLNNQAYKFVCK